MPGCCLMSLASPALVVLIPVMAIRAAPGGGGAAGFLRRAVMIYQADLTALTPACPHVPSCSQYAAEALDRHGAARGSWLTVRRLLRCRPGTAGGQDPVPPRS
jgi:uncharacterized protein